jgi:hypothetical protein
MSSKKAATAAEKRTKLAESRDKEKDAKEEEEFESVRKRAKSGNAKKIPDETESEPESDRDSGSEDDDDDDDEEDDGGSERSDDEAESSSKKNKKPKASKKKPVKEADKKKTDKSPKKPKEEEKKSKDKKEKEPSKKSGGSSASKRNKETKEEKRAKETDSAMGSVFRNYIENRTEDKYGNAYRTGTARLWGTVRVKVAKSKNPYSHILSVFVSPGKAIAGAPFAAWYELSDLFAAFAGPKGDRSDVLRFLHSERDWSYVDFKAVPFKGEHGAVTWRPLPMVTSDVARTLLSTYAKRGVREDVSQALCSVSRHMHEYWHARLIRENAATEKAKESASNLVPLQSGFLYSSYTLEADAKLPKLSAETSHRGYEYGKAPFAKLVYAESTLLAKPETEDDVADLKPQAPEEPAEPEKKPVAKEAPGKEKDGEGGKKETKSKSENAGADKKKEGVSVKEKKAETAQAASKVAATEKKAAMSKGEPEKKAAGSKPVPEKADAKAEKKATEKEAAKVDKKDTKASKGDDSKAEKAAVATGKKRKPEGEKPAESEEKPDKKAKTSSSSSSSAASADAKKETKFGGGETRASKTIKIDGNEEVVKMQTEIRDMITASAEEQTSSTPTEPPVSAESDVVECEPEFE